MIYRYWIKTYVVVDRIEFMQRTCRAMKNILLNRMINIQKVETEDNDELIQCLDFNC